MTPTFHLQCSSNVMMKHFDRGWDHQVLITKLAAAMLHNARELQCTRFAMLDDIREWPVRSPDEIKLSHETYVRLAAMGLSHCALCVNDIALTKWMMTKIIPPIVEVAFFNQLSECKNWLAAHGYDLEFGKKQSYPVEV